AEAVASDPQRRALADRVRPRPDLRLRARPARRGEDPRVLRQGPQLPDLVRALGGGFPLALPRRSRRDAPRAPAERLRGVARRLPAEARDPPRGRHRSERPAPRPPRRTEPQPRLDARRHRLRPSNVEPAPGLAQRRREGTPRGRPRRGDGRALRGRPLARLVRGLPDDAAGAYCAFARSFT